MQITLNLSIPVTIQQISSSPDNYLILVALLSTFDQQIPTQTLQNIPPNNPSIFMAVLTNLTQNLVNLLMALLSALGLNARSKLV